MKKISFPSMGSSKIAFAALMGGIPGVEVCYPPDVTEDIITMGSKVSPEFVCLPFKITLGEFINMYEKHGVRTFVQATDCGPCRFGFYAPVQERIMKDLGYDVEIIPIAQEDILNFKWLSTFYRLASSNDKVMLTVDIINCARRFFLKLKYLEDIRTIEGLVRCREIKKGDTTKLVKKLNKLLLDTNNFTDLHNFDKVIHREYRKLNINRDVEPLRIKFAGENHVALEPIANMDLIKKMGEEGVEIHLGNSIYDWVMHKCHLNFRRQELALISKEYCPLDIGGEAQWVIGDFMKSQDEEKLDGFIHVFPFTCMPENSARGILEGCRPDPFYLPIQFYSLDEHSGYEGLRTRVEAFIELMKTNRENDPRFMDTYVEPEIISKIWDSEEEEESIITSVISNIIDPLISTGTLLGKSILNMLKKE